MKLNKKEKYIRRRAIAELLIGQATMIFIVGMIVYGIIGG